MPLFGKRRDTARDEAERAEIERLIALPATDLAAEIMPAFGPEGPRGSKELTSLQITVWLMRLHPRGTKSASELNTAVKEALQVLEHAELVMLVRRDSPRVKATRLGEAALADGAVKQRINDRTGR
jgi:hypothetical protein